MKFSVPIAIATFVAVVSATGKCKALEAKIPDCATKCVNAAAANYCKPDELDCSCKPATLEKIIKDSSTCVSNVCKGQGPVFPPLRDWCECQIGAPTKTTTTAKPTATPTCAAEEDKIPSCAIACFNEEALKLCGVGEVECGCKPDNVEKIVKGSKACIADKCKNNEPPAVPPFRNFCKCINGDDGTTTTTTSSKPTKTSTSSSKPTDTTKTSETTTSSKPTHTSKTSSTTSSKPHSSTTTGISNSTTTTSKTRTATSQPVTITTTVITTTVCPITSCAPTATGCTTGDMTTETVTFTTTYCPPETETETEIETETDVVPCPTESVPDTGVPPYPTHPTGTDAPVAPTVSQVPSGSTVQPHPPVVTSSAGQPQPPAVTGAAASAQRNSGAVAGVIAAAVGFAWL